MKIECTTPMSAIQAAMEAEMERIRTVVLRRLMRAGEEAVNIARGADKNGKDWTDRTGNLRSSIGYVVVDNGKIVRAGGFQGQGPEGGGKGQSYAETLAAQMAGEQSALIVVAGMHYASYVADKGYDVLDSATTIAKKVINELQA